MAVVEILKILGNYYAELYQNEDIEELKDIKVMFSRRYDLYKLNILRSWKTIERNGNSDM